MRTSRKDGLLVLKTEKPYKIALDVYSKRDDRARGLHDSDVDMFYGCVLLKYKLLLINVRIINKQLK